MPGAGASGCRLGAGVPGGRPAIRSCRASGRGARRCRGRTSRAGSRRALPAGGPSETLRKGWRPADAFGRTRPLGQSDGRSHLPVMGRFPSQKCFHRRWATRTAFRPTSESVARHDTVTALQHPTLKAPDRLPSLRSSAAWPARERPSASRPKYPHARHPACHRPHPDRSSSTVGHPCTTRLVVGLGRSPGRAGPV